MLSRRFDAKFDICELRDDDRFTTLNKLYDGSQIENRILIYDSIIRVRFNINCFDLLYAVWCF